MKPSAFFISAVLLLAPAARGAIDPQLLSLALPDSKVLAGINVDQAKNSPFGQHLLAQIQDGDAGFQEFVTATGFDPRRDVREVFVSSTGQKGPHSGLVVVRGAFDVGKIVQAAQSKGQASENYNGVNVLADKGKTGAVALLSPTLALAGDYAMVHAAIDRRAAPARLDAALVAKASELGAVEDAWFVSTAPLAGIGASGVPDPQLQGLAQSDLISKLQQVSGGVKFGANVDIALQGVAPTSQDAGAIADILRFFKNMAQAKAGGSGSVQVTSLVQAINIATNANVVDATLSIPEDVFESLTAPRKRTGGAGAQARPGRNRGTRP